MPEGASHSRYPASRSPFQNRCPRPRRSASANAIQPSSRDSPRDATAGGLSWTRPFAAWVISNPTRSASRSHGVLTGRRMSAYSALGFGKMSACTWNSSFSSARMPAAGSACATRRFVPKATRPRIAYGLPVTMVR